MKMLKYAEYIEIRNRLDYIAEGLCENKDSESTLKWSYDTIKRLLYDIHELQRGMTEDNET